MYGLLRILLAQAITFLTRAGALAGANALPRIRRALRIGLHLVLPTERPPLEDEAQDAAALEGAPTAKIRKQASRPMRPSARLRKNEIEL